MSLRECSLCKEMKPATLEFFHKQNDVKSGLARRCKICKNKIKKEYETPKYPVRESNELKECSICKRKLPSTLFFFAKNSILKGGLRKHCKECMHKMRTPNDKRNERKINKIRRKQWKEEVMKDAPTSLSYSQLHKKMRTIIEKPKHCTICNQNKKLDLCSIAHTYTENPLDWIYLCVECHRLIDNTIKYYNTLEDVLEGKE